MILIGPHLTAGVLRNSPWSCDRKQRLQPLAQCCVSDAGFVQEGGPFGRRTLFQRSGKERFFGHFAAQSKKSSLRMRRPSTSNAKIGTPIVPPN